MTAWSALYRRFVVQQDEVPRSTYAQGPLSPPAEAVGDFTTADLDSEPVNTLDEAVWETVKRDLVRIGNNLILVVFPFKNWDQQSAALRNWDLWGPMVRSLRLHSTACVTNFLHIRVLQ